MILSFASRVGGGASGATLSRYLTEERDRDRTPEVMRGDPDLTGDLIDSLSTEHRYTHGYLSFTAEEHEHFEAHPGEREEIIDSFETHAFAGLEPDQYNSCWVRHEEEGREEWHFLVPKVELRTGKVRWTPYSRPQRGPAKERPARVVVV